MCFLVRGDRKFGYVWVWWAKKYLVFENFGMKFWLVKIFERREIRGNFLVVLQSFCKKSGL
jgi:hypothetical protein